MKTCLATIVAITLLPTFATAENDPPSGFDLTYGFGLVGISGVYVGQDDDLWPFPVFALSRGQWTLSIAKGIQFRALETATTQLSFAVVYDPAAETPNTALFAGLKRDDGAAFEIDASHDFGAVNIAGTVRRDVSQNHDGVSGDISVGSSIMMKNVRFEGRAGAHYLDGNYANFLYGVTTDEANALRNAYDVKANWSPFIEISAFVPLDEVTSIVGGFRHEQLSTAIANSPLVGSDELTTFGISVVRQF